MLFLPSSVFNGLPGVHQDQIVPFLLPFFPGQASLVCVGSNLAYFHTVSNPATPSVCGLHPPEIEICTSAVV